MTHMYSRIEVRPIAGSLGAEVFGLDLAKDLDDETIGEILTAYLAHQVVFFPDQEVSRERQVEISRIFGAPFAVPYVQHMPDHPLVIQVLKEKAERNISNFGGEWHADYTFLPEPPTTTMLYGAEVPPYGGDTLWANQYLAYETLSGGMKQLLEGVRAIHSGTPFGTEGQPEDRIRSKADGEAKNLQSPTSIKILRNQRSADTNQPHAVVQTHPLTGRKFLYINPLYIQRLENMKPAESTPLLSFLQAHATRQEFLCRYRWKPRTLAVWDNRCTQHYALNDYDGHRRLMYRTQISENGAIAKRIGAVTFAFDQVARARM